MASNDLVDVEGVIVEVMRDKFVVDTANGRVTAYVSGKIRSNKIRVVLGDRVVVQVSPYDLSNGRIVTRR
jgi:translation initiation factor IF-1